MKHAAIISIIILSGCVAFYLTCPENWEVRFRIDKSGKVLGQKQTIYYHPIITPWVRKIWQTPNGEIRMFSAEYEPALPKTLKSQIDAFMKSQNADEYYDSEGAISLHDKRQFIFFQVRYGHPIALIRRWNVDAGGISIKDEKIGHQ